MVLNFLEHTMIQNRTEENIEKTYDTLFGINKSYKIVNWVILNFKQFSHILILNL